MKFKRRVVSLFLLGVLLLGVCAIPGQADSQETAEMQLSLEKAVELAVENNPQVAIAAADRMKKSIAYSEAKKMSRKLSDTSSHSFEENKAEYLYPKIAELQEEQAEKVYEAAVNAVKLQVEMAYYDLLRAREQQAIAENALERADEQLRIANTRYTVGSAAKVEVMGAEAAQAGANAALVAARNNCTQKTLELNKIMGIDLDTRISLGGQFEFVEEDFQLQELLDRALDAEIKLIQAQDTSEISKWTHEFIVSIYTYSNWEARKGKQDMAMAELSAEQTRDNLITTVNQSYYNLLALEERYQYLNKMAELQEETYRLKKLSYEVGMATLEEVQEASNKEKEAEADVSDCIYSYNTLKSSLKNNIYSY